MLSLQNYSQLDPAWRNEPLGTQGRTLGSDGCTVSCVGMFVGKTPLETLRALQVVNGIMPSGDLIWPKVEEAFSGTAYFNFRWSTTLEERSTAYRKSPEQAYADICALLALGQPVILRLQHSSGFFHWVIAKEILPGDLLVHDPLGGVETPFSARYGPILSNLYAYSVLIKQPQGTADNISDGLLRLIVSNASQALPKAAAIEAGQNVQTYAKEILDTLI